MSQLNVRGIIWETNSSNYRTSFHHKNVSIITKPTWNDQEVSQVMTEGKPIFSSSSRVEAIQVGSVLLLEAYASRIKPIWEE